MNKQHAEIAVAAFADAQQDGFAPTGTLARDQTQPSTELATAFELVRVTHCRNQGGSTERADPLDLSQTLAALVLTENTLDAAIVLRVRSSSNLSRSLISCSISRKKPLSLPGSSSKIDGSARRKGDRPLDTTMPYSPSRPRISLANAVRHLIS
jgi:hypothetical protein